MLGTVFPAGLRNAEVVLPVTNMAEENGTYVNRDRRLQRFYQAKSQPGMARPAWWIAAELVSRNDGGDAIPSTAAEAFDLVAQHWPAFGGISYRDLGYTGRVLSSAAQEAAR
jgi:predicted molibdopterin-dependent oxidoreductase YjgC